MTLPTDIDLITHGSPCVNVSGKQAGGDKGSGTPSSLMWYTVDIVKHVRPKIILWENVKNILSPMHRHNFDNYLENLDYTNFYEVLNAKDYGIPQNRERVYTISIRNDMRKGIFTFPEPRELDLKLKDILIDEEYVPEKYYLNKPFTISGSVIGKLEIKGHDCIKRIYSIKGIAPTLTTMMGGNREPKIAVAAAMRGRYNTEGKTEQKLEISNREIANTITTVQKGRDIRVRKLIECWRLMNFDDEDFYKAQGAGISDTQLYRQAGNSIVVSVLEAIFKEVMRDETSFK